MAAALIDVPVAFSCACTQLMASFGLEGCEALIVGLNALVERGAGLGVEHIELGTSHRGGLQRCVVSITHHRHSNAERKEWVGCAHELRVHACMHACMHACSIVLLPPFFRNSLSCTWSFPSPAFCPHVHLVLRQFSPCKHCMDLRATRYCFGPLVIVCALLSVFL